MDGNAEDGVHLSDAGVLPTRPDDLLQFRLARLLVLLDVAFGYPKLKPLGIERLAYYDFFADSPFLVFEEGDTEHRDVLLAGFDKHNLSYQSSAQRFTNRRSRLQHDLAFLVAYGLTRAVVLEGTVTYEVANAGSELVASMRSLYARSYRRSAEVMIRHLNRLSDTQLRERAKRWLRAEPLLIDIYDSEPL